MVPTIVSYLKPKYYSGQKAEQYFPPKPGGKQDKRMSESRLPMAKSRATGRRRDEEYPDERTDFIS